MISFISEATGDTMVFRNLAEQVNYNTQIIQQLLKGGAVMPEITSFDEKKVARILKDENDQLYWGKDGGLTQAESDILTINSNLVTLGGQVGALNTKVDVFYEDITQTATLLALLAQGIVTPPEEE